MGRAFEVRKASMAKTNAMKSKLYAKFGKEIYVAAKSGTPNIESNSALKAVVEKAKSQQVPNDIINRAIKKAQEPTKETYNTILYEGFGPNSSMFIVECLTDNVNRTYSEVRNCFTKSASKLGVSGSVKHAFNQLAVFTLKVKVLEDDLLELLLEKEIEFTDIEIEDELFTLYAPMNVYRQVRDVLEATYVGSEFLISEIMWIATNNVKVEIEDDVKNYEKLMDMLNECEDVQNIYHNIELEE